jgi:hypothetical protein
MAMTGPEYLETIRELCAEKGVAPTSATNQFILRTCFKLSSQGVRCDRRCVEFVIDVTRAMTLCGLSCASSDEAIAAEKHRIDEWLEAMGWQPDWYLKERETPDR